MAWKIERWLSEVFPGEKKIYTTYNELRPRELAIVSAAVLDTALAELLSLRLYGRESEIEAFLGADGDGRAPAGSFGARIQLGLLLRLLNENDAAILRTIKQIRNLFAHRVGVDFLSPQVLKQTKRLVELLIERNAVLVEAGTNVAFTPKLEEIRTHLPNAQEAGEGILLAVFTVLQAYFHRMHPKVQKVGLWSQ